MDMSGYIVALPRSTKNHYCMMYRSYQAAEDVLNPRSMNQTCQKTEAAISKLGVKHVT
jgi:hypothetical protein